MKTDKMIALANADFLRGNRYRLTMNVPSALHSTYAGDMQMICENCNSIDLPGTDIATYEYASKGAPINLPYQRTYNPIVANFYVDAKGTVRKFFEDWIDVIWNPENYNMNYLDDFSVDLVIESLNTKNEVILTYNINHAWPLKIDNIPVSYADSEIQKCTATLTYNTYKLTKS